MPLRRHRQHSQEQCRSNSPPPPQVRCRDPSFPGAGGPAAPTARTHGRVRPSRGRFRVVPRRQRPAARGARTDASRDCFNRAAGGRGLTVLTLGPDPSHRNHAGRLAGRRPRRLLLDDRPAAKCSRHGSDTPLLILPRSAPYREESLNGKVRSCRMVKNDTMGDRCRGKDADISENKKQTR